MERAGNALSSWLGDQLDWTPQQREMAAFSLTLIVSTTFFAALLLAFSLLLGVFKEALVMAATAGLLKSVAGGAHLSTGWRCGIISASAATGAALIARTAGGDLVMFLGTAGSIAVIVVVGLSVSAVMYRLAPVDVAQKPITNEVHRQRLRTFATVYPIIWIGLCAIVFIQHGPVGASANDSLYSLWLASTIGLLWETFSVVPPGRRFVHWLDSRIGDILHGA